MTLILLGLIVCVLWQGRMIRQLAKATQECMDALVQLHYGHQHQREYGGNGIVELSGPVVRAE